MEEENWLCNSKVDLEIETPYNFIRNIYISGPVNVIDFDLWILLLITHSLDNFADNRAFFSFYQWWLFFCKTLPLVLLKYHVLRCTFIDNSLVKHFTIPDHYRCTKNVSLSSGSIFSANLRKMLLSQLCIAPVIDKVIWTLDNEKLQITVT